jgi:hypothetical protein
VVTVPFFSIKVLLLESFSSGIVRLGNSGSLPRMPSLPGLTGLTRERASGRRAAAFSGEWLMFSVGMPSLVRRCGKRTTSVRHHTSQRLPAADVDIVLFVIVVGSDGRKRWRTRMLGNRGQKSGWQEKRDPY